MNQGYVGNFSKPTTDPYMDGTANSGLMGQMLGDPLEVSASAVDQLVDYELQFFIEQLDDEKVKITNEKMAELKELDQEKRNLKLKMQREAEQAVEEIRVRLEANKSK